MKGYMTVTDAARLKKVSRQALYLAIQLNRLKAFREGRRWMVFTGDLEEYYSDLWKWIRHSQHQEKIAKCEQQGYYMIGRAAEKIGMLKNTLYYAIYTGNLKSIKRHGKIMVHVNDLMTYHKKHSNRNSPKK